ncbi:T9SS type A sorting domain-containing protein [bacterium]|nr:T9SS type A sorting domain-containing protein [bacterium]
MRSHAKVFVILGALLLLGTAVPATAQFVNGQPAVGVLGANDLVTRPDAAITASTLGGPNGVDIDPLTGKVFVVDRTYHRVLRWTSMDALNNGSAAEAVIGQADFTSGASGLAADRFNNPIGVHIDAAGRMWVGDYSNNRVLRFDDASNLATGAAADGVLGQPDFTTSSSGTTQTGMGGPVGLATDANGVLYVSNFGNHRVLRYDDAANKPNGAPADGVLGQPDFTTGTSATTQTGMFNPNDVCADADGNLWVSDYANRRVLRFADAATLPNGAPATAVLGKPDFTTGGSQTTQTGFGTTRYVEMGADGTLYMVGEGNNRLLVFKNAATLANGAPADYVLGQADFTSGGYLDPPTASSFRTPRACAVDDANGYLWVADYSNRRVVRYEFATGEEPVLTLISPAAGATLLEGFPYEITWVSSLVNLVDIDYSPDGGFTWVPVAADEDAAAGAYSWTVPAGATTQGRIRLTDAQNAALISESGDFTVEAPTYAVTVISPNGGQRWEEGAVRKILFSTVNVASVDIEISADGGATWTTVASGVDAGAGSYAWTVAGPAGDAYLVRVADAGLSGATDTGDAAFSVIPEITGDEFDYVFFADSPTPVYYDPSWSFVTAPSAFAQNGVKIPVSTERSLVGNYALSLAWTSQAGGDWGAAVASVGWTGHDVTQADSLVFHVYTDVATAAADLPCIYLEDLSNVRSPKQALSGLTGDVPAGVWHRIALPLQVFIDDAGTTDMTRIKTIFFGQQDADGVAHQWFMDDVRMTGVEVVTGEDVPLIVVLGSSTAAGTGASHPDSSWVGRYRNFVQDQYAVTQVVNLAVGGYTTYHLMPDGFTPPANRPSPSVEHNITRALAYHPWAIIVNLPSNDVTSGYSLEEQLANYDVITGLADAAGVPIWISTTQPRNLTEPSRILQHTMADTTLALYGDHAIDFWYGVALADGTIDPALDSGDGIHLNDAGHAVLYQRVVDSGLWEAISVTATEDPEFETPATMLLSLAQNYPNPFNPSTEIAFTLETPGRVTLDVFDMRGHLVRRLVNGRLEASVHTVTWDGRDGEGRGVSSGTYLYRLRTDAEILSRSMVLMR